MIFDIVAQNGSLSGFGRNRLKSLVVINLLSNFADEFET